MKAGRGPWILAAAIVGSSLGTIDGTAVNVSLPVMQRDLGAGASGLQWVVEAYALFLSALILVGGALGDRFGRRRMFTLGIALFTLASLACALAPSLPLLIAARCVQGAGAALFTPGSLALISASFSGAARGRAIGTWSGFGSITAAIGPVLGGWLTQTFTWRAIFLINLPLGALVVAIALLHVPESRDPHAPPRIDTGGASLATAGLAALVYGLIRLQTEHGGVGVALCAAGIALLLAFVWYESRVARTPMLRADLFRSRAFVGANLYTFLLYAGLGGSLYFVPYDLINVQGYPPLDAGAALLPFIAIMFLASRWSGGLVARIGARIPLVAGATLAALGFLAYARPGIGGSYWTTFFPAATILGLGGALFVAPLTTTVMDAVDVAEAGVASGVNNAVARTAGLVAIAGLGLALAATFEARLPREASAAHVSAGTLAALERERDRLLSGRAVDVRLAPDERARAQLAIRHAYVAGFRVAMICAALLALCAALVAAIWDLRTQSG